MKIVFFNWYVLFLLSAFFLHLSGCGRKDNNQAGPVFATPVNIGCNPATGVNCPPGAANPQLASQNGLYQFETGIDEARQRFEELPFPGFISVNDSINYFSPSEGGFEFNFFFMGGCVMGCNRKDQVNYRVESIHPEVVWMERSYPQKRNSSKRSFDFRRQDAIDKIFEKGSGNFTRAYKVCLLTNLGNLKGVMVVRFRQTLWGAPQITRRTVGIYEVPLPLNPVYVETMNYTLNRWQLNVITNGTINGNSFSVNFSQNSGVPIAACNY